MNRKRLRALGIQLPVLPAIVLGGLPGPPDWAPRLARIGLDVVASGADPDTDATLAAAAAAVPYRPIMACGPARLSDGSWIAQGPASDTSLAVDPSCTIVALDGAEPVPNPNDVAATVLPRIADDPSRWWVAAANFAEQSPDRVDEHLTALVEGVQLVRLYLAKQQFSFD
jgi:hypothetical protein